MDEDLRAQLDFLSADQQATAARTMAVAQARIRTHGLPDADRYRQGMVMGMLLDEPPADARPGRCEDCGDSIWIGPNSQQLIRQRPELPVLCAVCCLIGAVAVQQAGGGLDVHQASHFLHG